MKIPPMGLRGKFVTALSIAAALPLLVGLIVLQTLGFRHLLTTRGRMQEAEAKALARSLEHAVYSESGHLDSWMASNPVVPDFAAAPQPAYDPQRVRELDQQWSELPPGDPSVAAVLANPAAIDLGRYRHRHPAIAEILLADMDGRVIAATDKTSDYDQSDERWWSIGHALKEGRIWTDELHFDDSADVFSLDLVMPVWREGRQVAVAKIVLDVSPLFAGLERANPQGADLEILLPDGRVLTKGPEGYGQKTDFFDSDTVLTIRVGGQGWTIARNTAGQRWMTGFASIQPSSDTQRFEPGGYVLFSTPREQVVAPLRRQLLQTGGGALAAVAICLLGGYFFVRGKILRPLQALSQAARTVAGTARLKQSEDAEASREAVEADLARIQAIRTGDEVEALAGDFAVMTSRVLRYHRELEAEVAAKTAVIREDLEMAREFQNALLPSSYPDAPPSDVPDPLRLGFAHFYQPASTVGGDFFDLIEIDEHRTGILIADVMGHGARSALITAILRALVRNHAIDAGEPAKFLGMLNTHLHELVTRSGQTLFVTAFYMVLDTFEEQAAWAVAGHPAPLRARRGTGNPPQPLWTTTRRQPALGLLLSARYEASYSAIRAGDVFLLYTDGVVEAENPDGGEFGMERLKSTFDESLDGPLAAMPAKIVCEVAAFQKRRQQDDDVCVVAVEISPGGKPANGEPRLTAGAASSPV